MTCDLNIYIYIYKILLYKNFEIRTKKKKKNYTTYK